MPLFRLFVPILLALLCLPLGAVASASDFRIEADTLFLDGQIKAGDAESFAGLLAANPDVKRVSINSPGGDLATGLKMGEIVRKRGLHTFVEAGTREAASAAAYLFMAGTERVVKGERGVGVHAFYTSQAELRKMIKQKSGEELFQTLTEFERRTQEGTVAVVEYVTKMIGDSRIVSEAVKTGSDAMFWPPTKTLVEWKVATKRIELSPEEIPDPDWAYGEVVAGLAGWLDQSRPDALDDWRWSILDGLLGDPERMAQIAADVDRALAAAAPLNRDQARGKVVTPIVEGIVRRIRAIPDPPPPTDR